MDGVTVVAATNGDAATVAAAGGRGGNGTGVGGSGIGGGDSGTGGGNLLPSWFIAFCLSQTWALLSSILNFSV